MDCRCGILLHAPTCQITPEYWLCPKHDQCICGNDDLCGCGEVYNNKSYTFTSIQTLEYPDNNTLTVSSSDYAPEPDEYDPCPESSDDEYPFGEVLSRQ